MARSTDKYFPGHFMGDEDVEITQQKLEFFLHHNMKQISKSLDNLNQIGTISHGGGNWNCYNKNGIYPRLINSFNPLGYVHRCVQKVLNCREYNFCNTMESIPGLNSAQCSDFEPKVVKKMCLKGFDEMVSDENIIYQGRNGLGINVITRKPILVSNLS